MLEAQFQKIRVALDASRRQAAQAARESEHSKEALARAHVASLAVASERDQAMSTARDLAGFASESSPKLDELKIISNTQVTQAQHLKDHVRLAERRIDEVDGEKQIYMQEGMRMKETIVNLEKRIRELEMVMEEMKSNAKLNHSRCIAMEKEFNAATSRTQELEDNILQLTDDNSSLMQQLSAALARGMALMGELSEKSKPFDNFMAQHRAINETPGVTEARVREEFSLVKGENARLRNELDKCRDDLTTAVAAMKARLCPWTAHRLKDSRSQ